MPQFELDCPIVGETVWVILDGSAVRGAPEFRGFACESEAACQAAGIACALFQADGAHPFSVADALRWLGDGR